MKTRFFNLAAICLIASLSFFSTNTYAFEDDEFSYFAAEFVKHELDTGTATETANGHSIRFSNSLTRRLHIRSEFVNLEFDGTATKAQSFELGVGFVLINAPSSKIYLAAAAKRDKVADEITGTAYANTVVGLAGLRLRSAQGIEGIFELKHVQPEDDTQENGQIIEVGVRIFPPEDDSISLGIRANAFESGETSGNTQQFRVFLEIGF